MSAAWVYRCFDRPGRLIYIGMSTDLFGRLDAHRAKAWWAPDAAKVTAKVYPSEFEARQVERAAIASENPRWNVMGRWRSRFGWTADDYADYHRAVVMTGNAHASTNRLHLEKVRRECLARFGFDLGTWSA